MVHEGAAVAIFAGTYALVSAGRLRWLPLGRPTAALAGAVLMVLVAGLSPAEAYASIDHGTLALLLGMMGIVAYLARAGFFALAEAALLRRFPTPVALLAGTGLLAGALSALLVNDAVCLFLTPVVVGACVRQVPRIGAESVCRPLSGYVCDLVGDQRRARPASARPAPMHPAC